MPIHSLQQALLVAEQRVSQLEAAVKAKERLVEAGQKALENSRWVGLVEAVPCI